MSHHQNKGHSDACCNTPPIKVDYTDKGSYSEINGLKTYVTGDKSADEGIIVIYDIFGFSPQGNQGADILASSDQSKKYQVFIPDILDGTYADLAWFPPDTEEKSKKLGDLLSGPASPASKAPGVLSWSEQLVKDNPNIKKWAIVGFCWGAKLASLTLQKSDVFSVAAVAHPSMVDVKEAEGIKVPFILIASKDENAETCKAFIEALKVPKQIEFFKDQIHGFMGARSNLKDDHVAAEYKRGYETILHFLHKHL